MKPLAEEKRRRIFRLVAEAGYTWKQAAEREKVNIRTVARVMAGMKGNDHKTEQSKGSPPKPYSKLEPDVQALCADTPEAFRAFNDRYWPEQPMPDHIFRFVQATYASKRNLITVPPNHAKSSYFTVRRTVWRIASSRALHLDGQLPHSRRIILISETAELATQFCGEITLAFTDNERLVGDFGRFNDSDDASVLWQPGRGSLRIAASGLSRGYNVLSRGVGTQIQGLRADEVVADDIIGPDNVLTEDRRAKTSHWFRNIVLPRLDPLGTCNVIGTRQHLYDLYYELAELRVARGDAKRVWVHVNFPAITNEDGAPVVDFDNGIPLWPDERGLDFLADVYDNIGSQAFQQTYMQDPIPPENRLVQPEWIYGTDTQPGCVDKKREAGQGFWPRQEVVRVIALDPSPTQKAALLVVDVKPSKDLFECAVIDLLHRQMGVREMVSNMKLFVESYGPIDYLIVEINAAQRWLMEDPEFMGWARNNSIRVKQHTTTRTKADPQYGLRSLAPDFEFGRVHLPYADVRGRMDVTKRIADEAIEYGFHPTDDCLMALWFAKNNFANLKQARKQGVASALKQFFHAPPRLTGVRW